MPYPRTPNHIEISCINGTVVYRVDNPRSGCSAGFWAAKLPGVPGETRFELDFQHSPRCRCLGRDTDAPAVQALLQSALGLVDPRRQDTAAVRAGVYHEAGSAIAAMLVFLKRTLRLRALGESELDLWDDVCYGWPPPCDGGYCDDDECEYCYDGEEEEEEEMLVDERRRGRIGTKCSRCAERRINKLKKKRRTKKKQSKRLMMIPTLPQMRSIGNRRRADSGSKATSPCRRMWIEISSRIGGSRPRPVR